MSVNRLRAEQSPYLLQHADNPVFWYPWGPQAFAAAAGADKPILLSIGYSTCHWCHVMAHESFENGDIAKVLNDHFIAVKVDREERPDVDHVYMAAVVAMTGQGGWPLTVFLTPGGKPFYGGTYFPPYVQSGSQGFKDILLSIADAWHNNREGILSSSDEITRSLNVGAELSRPGRETRPLQDELSESILDAAFRQMSAHFDAVNGGFGSSPKFPMPHGLGFLLRYHHRVPRDEKALAMVEETLTAMARGGIWDHIGFGFHRYSTDAQWHIPHFEKMLYDQALLARVYLEAFQVTGKKTYADIAENIFTYVLRDMRHSQGGFYCAEDADSVEGERSKEGVFYVWTEKEIIEVLGKDAAFFNDCYGVRADGGAAFDPHGEFAGKNILFLSKEPDDEQMAACCRQRLFERRQTRSRPHLDDKVIVDWNGLMICALAFGGRVLGKERYVDAARAAADFILSRLMDHGRLLHRWRQDSAGPAAGVAGIPATLEDYAFFMTGLIDLYEASFEGKYLEQAKRLARVMQELFEDEINGGFYMTARDAETLIMDPKEIYDGAIPSGNSASALALLRLHALTGEEGFYASASRIFACFSGVIRQAPSAYPLALCAYDFYREGGAQVVLSGPTGPASPAGGETIAKMTKVLYKHFVPNKSVVYEAGAQRVMARVCKGRTCLPPTDDPAVLERQIGDVHEGR